MYQYSLDSFTLFFLKSLHLTKNEKEKIHKVKELQISLRDILIKWILRGLYEKHRLTFLILLIISLIENNIISEECGFSKEGLRFLLLGPNNGDEKRYRLYICIYIYIYICMSYYGSFY
jgi:hypothetical protein